MIDLGMFVVVVVALFVALLRRRRCNRLKCPLVKLPRFNAITWVIASRNKPVWCSYDPCGEIYMQGGI